MTSHVDNEARVIINAFHYMKPGPRSLAQSVAFAAQETYELPEPSVEDVFARVERNGANDLVSVTVEKALVAWDYAAEAPWVSGTKRNTQERRNRIYELLGFTSAQGVHCGRLFPIFPALEPPTVITEVHRAAWRPWYSQERRLSSAFYWNAYFGHLAGIGAWEPRNLAALDEATTDIVQRLADPTGSSSCTTKGLAVGYVQSGKTANFTGVIAKAVDAGYRLVIVLAGTLDILREQTQRRLDKELIGRELVADDYEGDAELASFVSHGALPSDLGAFDWERLTLAKQDFQQMLVGLTALEFQRADPSRPFYDPANLRQSRARLLVVKKNATVLDKVLRALGKVGQRYALGDVPALIIDDESDQASVNTARRLSAKERAKRTAINQRIVALLRLLPRGQYVGYTATPFANVFIDPQDAEDLFPSDFIITLPRPEGYMGVSDFYDTDEMEDGDFTSNRQAFVRFVGDEDEKLNNLPQAIDAYVLTGALKLWRAANGSRAYRHHTMLVHHSAFTNVHVDQATLVRRLLNQANYAGGGPGVARLRTLFKEDFLKVSAVQRGDAPMAERFEQVAPFISQCCAKINEGGRPVLIVNGENDEDAPDFERAAVWKIIVGGTKLSRGYTIEGLTVSYYRRKAGAADTLMQMGRWFGFRRGYRDLVRLYIGNREPLDRHGKRFVNLYEAFRSICLDEEEFRAELERYSSLEEGQRVTPKQIPPLVPSTMLRPTSPNKMFNAQVEFENFGGRWVEKTVATADDDEIRANAEATRKLLENSSLKTVTIGVSSLGRGTKQGQESSFRAFVGTLQPDIMLQYLQKFNWAAGKRPLDRVCDFLVGKRGDPGIGRWLVVAPQPIVARPPSWTVGGAAIAVRERSRTGNGEDSRYGVFSESLHVSAAEYLNCLQEGKQPTASTASLRDCHQAVMLFYPVLSAEERKAKKIPTMGFALVFPQNTLRTKIKYSVIDPTQEDAVVVEVRLGRKGEKGTKSSRQ
jgi:hypothetical protein